MAQVDDVQHTLRGDNVGRELKIVLLRGGEKTELHLTVAERTGRSK